MIRDWWLWGWRVAIFGWWLSDRLMIGSRRLVIGDRRLRIEYWLLIFASCCLCRQVPLWECFCLKYWEKNIYITSGLRVCACWHIGSLLNSQVYTIGYFFFYSLQSRQAGRQNENARLLLSRRASSFFVVVAVFAFSGKIRSDSMVRKKETPTRTVWIPHGTLLYYYKMPYIIILSRV